MESKQTSFSQSLAMGQEGEHLIANYFLSSSCIVLPLYQFSTSCAPAWFTASGKIVAPDLFVIKNKTLFFVEVKYKQRWINWEGIIQTGLDRRHYDEYKRIADVTGLPVYLIFIHEKEPPFGIYYTTISAQIDREWNGIKPDGSYVTKPEVFFFSESLRRLPI